MNYDLTKKLKDAGYPFKTTNWEESQQVKQAFFLDEPYGLGYIAPSLEELIEAVGESFHCLNQHGTWSAQGDKLWKAEPKGQPYKDMKTGTGATPLIAVANLYLALNK